jgi:excisionase family DNA binding protein
MLSPRIDAPGLLDERELATYLKVSVLKVRKLRYAGKLPFIRLGHKSIRFRLSSVLAALEKLESKAVS